MIPTGLMAGLGGAAAGGLLGQLTDALGAPRRAVMGLVGQGLTGRDDIESGSALLEAMGASPGGLASSLGGFAADTALDPLTYAGMIGGALAPSMLENKSALMAIGAGGSEADGAVLMQKAAQMAGASNEARGLTLGTEPKQLARLGRAVTPEDVAAASPRTGLYGRNMTRTTGMEANSTVSPNVASPPGLGAGATRPKLNAARAGQMASNATANDAMLEGAQGAYNDPFQGGTGGLAGGASPGSPFTLPGQLLAPDNPARGNLLMQMEPHAAQQGIDPLLAQLVAGQGRKQGMSPLELAMLGGSGAGALGGGVYAGMNRRQ